MQEVTVFSPASIGNFGPAFDVLGVAVTGKGDIVTARKLQNKITIKNIESERELPTDPNKNTAGIAAQNVLDLLGNPGGVELSIKKGVPFAAGLGSSACSAAAAAHAVNVLYGEKLSKRDLIHPVTLAEEAVSGGYFCDNTAPALIGGVSLTRSLDPLDIRHICTHMDNLFIALVTPDVEVLTRQAREALPKKVELPVTVRAMAHASMVSAALASSNYSLLVDAINDPVVEPVRAKFIKGFDEVKQSALDAGADGCSISGSGPTLFAISNNKERARKIADSMTTSFKKQHVIATSMISQIDKEGAKIIGQK